MANTFITLTDTPSTYTGSVGKYLQVSGTNTLIFNTIGTNNLSDVETSGAYTPLTGQVLTYTSSGKWRPVTNDPYSVSNGLNKSGSTLNVVAGTGGGLTSNTSGVFITDIANVAGTHGNASYHPVLTVNSKGQITDISVVESSIKIADTLSGNYVQNLAGTAGQITVIGGSSSGGNATVNLVATGVTAGTYGNATHSPQITVDTYGRIQNVDLIEIDGNVTVGVGNSNISLSDIATEAYKNIVVAGQTTLSADNPADTLTIVAGTGISLTTTASSDTLTISSTGESANSIIANTSISALADVDTTGIADGQALIYDATNAVFVAGNVASDSANISTSSVGDLVDVDLTGIVNGQLLQWDAANSTFVPSTISTGGTGDITAVIAGNGLTGGAFSGAATLNIGAGTGIDVSADAIALSNTAVTPGTYGDAGNVAQFTVDQQGRITSVTEIAITNTNTGSTTDSERFRINYASDGTLSGTQDLTAGISSVVINSSSGGEVSITFDSSQYNYPPGSILFYGYDYVNNKYIITPFDTTMTVREIAAGGVSGSPTLFNGNSTVTIRLRLRETETGASRGSFGTTTHAYVQFVMNG